MAWIRLDDQIPRHDKIAQVGPAAAWVWVCCIAHCQSQLTDGVISDSAMRVILSTVVAGDLDAAARSSRPLDDVFASAQGLVTRLVTAKLLDTVTLGGFVVHDYLDYNPSKDAVLRKRREDLARKRGYMNDSAQNPGGIRADSAQIPERSRGRARRPAPASDPIRSDPIPNTKYKLTPETETHTTSGNGNSRASLSPAAPEHGNPKTDPFTNRAVTERAGRFVDRYQVLYPEHRKGARYAVKPARDYAAAVTLCATWVDDAYLDKLAVVFLTTDHKFAEEGSRTIPQFLAIASWCDGRLREWAVREGVTL